MKKTQPFENEFFHQATVRICSQLNIEIGMSNTLEHQEVIKLKDRLTDDNRYLFDEMFRNKGPMIAVNCGAIPDSLIDSELFRHEKGTFTGALTQKRGRFERADGGTIFLDEIGELPPPAQVRLLRVLQNKEFERVGGIKRIKVDIRIIAATNKNIEETILEGTFREDLWFRLNVFPIQIPPLRERKHDIPAPVHFFLETKTKELKLENVPDLAPSAMSDLKKYGWPGNVRELENIVERELILNPGGPLTFSAIRQRPRSKASLTYWNEEDAIPTFDDLAKDYFKKVLTITNGKINGTKGAAQIAGIAPNTLRNKKEKLKVPFDRSTTS